jgi:acyl-CoA thioester hydrolase
MKPDEAANVPEPLAAFPVVLVWPVQWGDQDAFGHVNNTIYFRWFESSRIAYLERIGLGDKSGGGRLGPILAAISCNYRRQLKYPDTVQIGSRVTRIGRSSIVMEHIIWSTAQQAVVAEGQGTIVVFDYQANIPNAVPDELRSAIGSLEGKAF